MAKQVIENKNLDKTRKFIESNFKISKEIQINIFTKNIFRFS